MATTAQMQEGEDQHEIRAGRRTAIREPSRRRPWSPKSALPYRKAAPATRRGWRGRGAEQAVHTVPPAKERSSTAAGWPATKPNKPSSRSGDGVDVSPAAAGPISSANAGRPSRRGVLRGLNQSVGEREGESDDAEADHDGGEDDRARVRSPIADCLAPSPLLSAGNEPDGEGCDGGKENEREREFVPARRLRRLDRRRPPAACRPCGTRASNPIRKASTPMTATMTIASTNSVALCSKDARPFC